MRPTTIILITGHPATGKTTFARYLAKTLGLPTLCKDDFKEILYDTLGWSTVEWSKQLGAASMTLIYRYVEVLLEARTDHVVEANFDPKFANAQWQALKQRFNLQVIQVRCECDPATTIARYRARIADGTRHPGHRDGGDDFAFHELLRRGPIEWVDLAGERISLDTTAGGADGYKAVVQRITELGLFAPGQKTGNRR
jgi:predicted kinase